MPTQITIYEITGSSPYNVYTCDTGFTTCVYVDTVVSFTDIPYSFYIPVIMEKKTKDAFVFTTIRQILENLKFRH